MHLTTWEEGEGIVSPKKEDSFQVRINRYVLLGLEVGVGVRVRIKVGVRVKDYGSG